jgi:hypothetical protein
VPDGNWILAPHKRGDRRNGISALDAAYVLQYVAGGRQLDAWQLQACDASASGMLSALDATRILQVTVGLLPELPSAAACGSDWLFVPEPAPVPNQSVTPPLFGAGQCRPGAVGYAPLIGDALGQDFRAVLLGDCTGNWAPPTAGGRQPAVAQRASATTLVTRMRHMRGGRLRAALIVRSRTTIQSIEATLASDPAQLRLVNARAVLGARGAVLAFNQPAPGTIALALASPAPIAAGTRVGIVLEFVPRTSNTVPGPLTVQQLTLDE